MLVLKRKKGSTTRFDVAPSEETTVIEFKLLECGFSAVRIAISAPDNVRVIRDDAVAKVPS